MWAKSILKKDWKIKKRRAKSSQETERLREGELSQEIERLREGELSQEKERLKKES